MKWQREYCWPVLRSRLDLAGVSAGPLGWRCHNICSRLELRGCGGSWLACAASMPSCICTAGRVALPLTWHAAWSNPCIAAQRDWNPSQLPDPCAGTLRWATCSITVPP